MVIETIVPLNDVCFSNKITRPCKEYSVIFILNDLLINYRGIVSDLWKS